MTIKSIMQEALNTASTYAQSVKDGAMWLGRSIASTFNTQVIERVKSVVSFALNKTSSIASTPVGKISLGLAAAGVVGVGVIAARYFTKELTLERAVANLKDAQAALTKADKGCQSAWEVYNKSNSATTNNNELNSSINNFNTAKAIVAQKQAIVDAIKNKKRAS